MIGIPEEAVADSSKWIFDEAGRVGVVYCPSTSTVGLFMPMSGRWFTYGPVTFDEAVEFIRDQVPELLPPGNFVEVWRARIEQAGEAHH
ncbi:MAG: hypothetical protein HND55_08830 [Pseudomonadota bacterium]|nr:MAG: hypothetical protein HND55_08830 [Pseudomonadota bacterium]